MYLGTLKPTQKRVFFFFQKKVVETLDKEVERTYLYIIKQKQYFKPLKFIKMQKSNSLFKEDQPLYKLQNLGGDYLSNAELLTLIIGANKLDVCIDILQSVENDINKLATMTLKDLEKFKGIGAKAAAAIKAIAEISKRKQISQHKDLNKITCSKDIYNVLCPHIENLEIEEFWVIYLNRSNVILKKEKISIGGVSGTVVDAKVIFKGALQNLASSIILSHNHPSGNLKPSQADIDITRKMRRAGEALDITVLDHVIISNLGYYSFADEGQM